MFCLLLLDVFVLGFVCFGFPVVFGFLVMKYRVWVFGFCVLC